MMVSSTSFTRPDINEHGESPDGVTQNQIDHILVNKRHAINVMNDRTYRGANCDSDLSSLHEVLKSYISKRSERKMWTKEAIN